MNKIKNYLFFGLYLISRPGLLRALSRKLYLPVYVQFEWLRKYPITTVIDIGANVGQVTRVFADLFSAAKIHAFEPIPELGEQLRRNLVSPNITINTVALSDQVGTTDFFVTEHVPASSMLEPLAVRTEAQPTFKASQKLTVPTTTLDTYFSDHDLSGTVFLKIDVQGAEHLVFAGGSETLKRVKIIHIETSHESYYAKQSLFSDIYEMLTKAGFTYMGSVRESEFYPSFFPQPQENSIFIRR